MKIVISRFEHDLLLAHPETEAITRKLLFEIDERKTLKGTADQYDSLRDACSELLQRIGFNEEYTPTGEGMALEGLIDKLLT